MNIRIWITRIVLIVLIGFWMGTIFGFSAENGSQSQSLSDRITIRVVKIIAPQYDSLSSDEQQQLFDETSFAVRKTGHFGEYGILGLLIAGFLVTFHRIKNSKRRILLAVETAVCTIYAITDEFHQGFVEGRSPKVADVMIDTAGGFTAGIIFILIWMIIDRKRKDNECVGN